MQSHLFFAKSLTSLSQVQGRSLTMSSCLLPFLYHELWDYVKVFSQSSSPQPAPPLHVTITASLLVGIWSRKVYLLHPLLPGKGNSQKTNYECVRCSAVHQTMFPQIWTVWVADCVLLGGSFIICISNASSISSLGSGSTVSVPFWFSHLLLCLVLLLWGALPIFRPPSILTLISAPAFWQWVCSLWMASILHLPYLSFEAHTTVTQKAIPEHVCYCADNLFRFAHHPCSMLCT